MLLEVDEKGSFVGSVSTEPLSRTGLDRAEERGVAGGKGGSGGDAIFAGRSLFDEDIVEAIVVCDGEGEEGRGGGTGASSCCCFFGDRLTLFPLAGDTSFFGGLGERLASRTSVPKVLLTGVWITS